MKHLVCACFVVIILPTLPEGTVINQAAWCVAETQKVQAAQTKKDLVKLLSEGKLMKEDEAQDWLKKEGLESVKDQVLEKLHERCESFT